MNGCMLPGRIISVAGAVCLGATTETEGTAISSVTARSVVSARTRERIPKIKTNTAASVTSAGISQRRGDFRGSSWGLPWQAFVSMVWPDFYHVFELNLYNLPWNPTFLYLYCGISALLFIVAAVIRRSRYAAAFGSLTLFALFWMMGTHTLPGRLLFPFVFDLAHDSVYVEFTMVVFSLGISVLVALGANAVLRRPQFFAAAIAITSRFIYPYLHGAESISLNYKRFKAQKRACKVFSGFAIRKAQKCVVLPSHC